VLQYNGGCYVIVTSLVLFRMYDILKRMKNIQINCNYCNTPVIIKRDKIYMKCHCDEDRRIIDLQEYLLEDKHHDYLYSMFSDGYEFHDEKCLT